MANKGQIVTIKEFHISKLKEKNSLFIAQSFPVENEEDFQKILAEAKKKYYNATHHCYAYKLQNNLFKYSDDGEPTGTAGIRILNSIEHFNLINIGVIVIRYFGGTKLGIGLLGKTYYESAFHNLSQAEKISRSEFQRINIKVDFEFVNLIHRTLSSINAKIESINYENKVEFVCFIKPTDLDETKTKLIDLTHGAIVIHNDDEHIFL